MIANRKHECYSKTIKYLQYLHNRKNYTYKAGSLRKGLALFTKELSKGHYSKFSIKYDDNPALFEFL